MDVPKPVDLNRLKSILGGAKQVMDKVNGQSPERSNNTMVETYSQPVQTPIDYSEDRINNTKMPDAIKKMMIENPPVAMDMNYSFSASDVGELAEKPMNENYKRPVVNKQQVNNSNSDLITISVTQLNEMINKAVDARLLDFMTQTFTKSLSEKVISKTVTTLINEGKINTVKKK